MYENIKRSIVCEHLRRVSDVYRLYDIIVSSRRKRGILQTAL